MKIAVGIIALVFSMIALMQSCTVTGLSGAIGQTGTQEAGAVGMLMAIAMFLGGAFAFGLPRMAQIFFLANFGLSFVARENFPDLQVWGWVAAILAFLLVFSGGRKSAEKA